MKLKKVASLCSKTKIFCLYDREESGGEVSQWLGDSSAIYPITGLPYMDEENIYSMFDISAKQQEKIIFRHQHAPEGINISDTDPTEHRIDEESLSLVYDGGVLKPLQTRNGISFIQNKYLSPLEDVIDMVQLYERETPQGMTYIVAKTGLFVAAVIMPYNVINEKFVYTSAAAASGKACKPGPAKVTMISKGAKHPYHLIKQAGGGSTVYGWVNAADVQSETDAAIDKLAGLGVINSPDYWKNAVAGGKVAYLDILFTQAAAKITKAGPRTADVKSGVGALVKAGVINTPEYWLQNYGKLQSLDLLLCALGGAV